MYTFKPLHLLRSTFGGFFQLQRVTFGEKRLLSGGFVIPIWGRSLRRALSTSATAYSCHHSSPRARATASGGEGKERELGRAGVNGG